MGSDTTTLYMPSLRMSGAVAVLFIKMSEAVAHAGSAVNAVVFTVPCITL
ncbi:hypothetical protein Barb7_03185 [Bacteroidales bacterium Barb7]|nr:hypothetical protein Barb7_03185 [Bacteroidales bacterium Barb7]